MPEGATIRRAACALGTVFTGTIITRFDTAYVHLPWAKMTGSSLAV